MEKLRKQFSGEVAELEDMQKDIEEHKEDMASDGQFKKNVLPFLVVVTFMICTIDSQFLGLWKMERAGTSPKDKELEISRRFDS